MTLMQILLLIGAVGCGVLAVVRGGTERIVFAALAVVFGVLLFTVGGVAVA